MHQNHPKGFLKCRLLGLTPYLVGLVWDLRNCIFNKFPGEIDAADPGITLQNHSFDAEAFVGGGM